MAGEGSVNAGSGKPGQPFDAGTSRPPDAESGPAFELSRVDFRYDGGEPVLRGIDLSIRFGERVAILGANGCGKSTLLKILDGLLFPAAGIVRVFGDPIDAAALRDSDMERRLHRRVGFVFQNADAQLFSSTVREEIAFGPIHLGFPPEGVESRVADVAAMLGLDGLLDRPPFQLSGGEKRKVAIASVLVINPEAILLDEPTSDLDPRSRQWIIDLLDVLHRAGKTIVSATHDLEIVPAIADRGIILSEDHGILACGPIDSLLEDRALLMRANLIHEHAHKHDGITHSHAHSHGGAHEHEHMDQPAPLERPSDL
jgi:cobalt/nickel transport system ATP-binding protein